MRKDRQLDLLQQYQRELQRQGAAPVQTWRSPTRPPGFVSDYVVPLAHAITWGILAASLITILYNQGENSNASLWLIWFVWFLVVTIFAYSITSAAIWSLLWSALENVLQKDLDKSGEVGDRPIIKGRRTAPSDRGVSGRLNARGNVPGSEPGSSEETSEEEWNSTRVAQEFPFGASENTMQWFVRVSGDARVGTGTRIWEPILGRKRYNQYRDAIIAAEWGRWNSYSENGKPNVTKGWCYDVDPQKVYEEIS